MCRPADGSVLKLDTIFLTTSLELNSLVQERRNSIANALELRLSCTYPLICVFTDYPEFIEYKRRYYDILGYVTACYSAQGFSLYARICLNIKSREVSNLWDLYLELSDRSEIWQASLQHCSGLIIPLIIPLKFYQRAFTKNLHWKCRLPYLFRSQICLTNWGRFEMTAIVHTAFSNLIFFVWKLL